ncbi:type II toxin-antitoxin system prevent-host-death family antitoxin [Mannheimia sp. AT1]|uniref:Antitoxin n=1 Tax=Mannheimia cairinae TaxID=3025936 RepID=A0ABT5MQ07_9PAST|nr:type II toxin-antitoxin system prevent-host-death family antitoxin [Mannheimia cairinae]MDD0824264.1 type II toxin-antitoxin system prevent-host-death family antitoxin [Mannheimia cairinae]MDD0826613.1 type II toxin-antitoxin system prevent-host-death family antitoxin [Mannheimia cairinae]
MAITITSREFNQNASKVLKMAEKEPVFITKWGKIVSVVSSYVDYKQQTKPQTLADIFASPSVEEDEVDMADFEQILRDIRKNSKCRTVDFD